MDVNGNDNQPEWGYCTANGCTEAAFPIWESGAYPDDPDLLLCETHIGAEIARLRDQAVKAETARDAWTEIGAKAETDAGALRTCLLAIRADAADYGPEPQGITKGYVWAGALLREIDQVLAAVHPGAALLAELQAARAALEEIDRHVVGAHALSWDAMSEPCDECGEMREIASQALAAMRQARTE